MGCARVRAPRPAPRVFPGHVGNLRGQGDAHKDGLVRSQRLPVNGEREHRRGHGGFGLRKAGSSIVHPALRGAQDAAHIRLRHGIGRAAAHRHCAFPVDALPGPRPFRFVLGQLGGGRGEGFAHHRAGVAQLYAGGIHLDAGVQPVGLEGCPVFFIVPEGLPDEDAVLLARGKAFKNVKTV